METIALVECSPEGAAPDVWLETFGPAALADACAQTQCLPALPGDTSEPVLQCAYVDRCVTPAGPRHGRRRWTWLASVLLHGAVLGIFLLAFGWLTEPVPRRHQSILIPQGLRAAFSRRPGGVWNPGVQQDPLRAALQDQRLLLHAHGFSVTPTLTHISGLLRGGGLGRAPNMIGLGASAGAAPGGLTGAQRALARFGLPGGGKGLAPKSQLLGIGGNARRIVYVLDNSGSMINGFPVLRRAVRRSIRRLRAFQRFAVIVFAHRYHLLGPPELQRATGAIRSRVIYRLDRVAVSAGGGNDGRIGPFLRPLKAAFDLTPPAQLIYFVTDGHFSRGLIHDVRKLNRGRHTAVFTYAFFDRDRVYRRRLARMAHENRGKFKYIKRQ